MSPSSVSNRIGLFALLMGVIVFSLFGGLVLADHALVTASVEAARGDAYAAARATERELRLRASDLEQELGPLLPGTPSDSLAPVPGFAALWIVDAHGDVVARHADIPETLASQQAVASAAASARREAPIVRIAPAGLLLAVPLRHRGALLGSAVGLVRGDSILRLVRDSAQHPRQHITLRSRDGEIAALGMRERVESYVTVAERVHLPGDSLVVEVAEAQRSRALRAGLWLLGVLALVGLFAGISSQRKQANYLAGRTAELERLYQEVARSNRMKSEFLANVSHELRTPLNAVVGFVEMLREGVYGELTPRQALPVDRIAASATHLRHLVDRLLDIAKIAAGRLEVHPEPLVLRAFVLNLASEMESLVSEGGHALSIAVAPTLPRIRTDPTHLRQILINLIGNAVKYTPRGSIQVRAQLVLEGEAAPPDHNGLSAGSPPDPRRPWVALQVSDTGVGIAPADRERIFDEFEQVNAGARTDSQRRGTGLGLAISRRLARILGGELTVASEPGVGSVFTVWLPLQADGAPERADVSPALPGRTSA